MAVVWVVKVLLMKKIGMFLALDHRMSAGLYGRRFRGEYGREVHACDGRSWARPSVMSQG